MTLHTDHAFVPDPRSIQSRNLENRLQLLDQCPFVHRYIRPVELLQRVDARARNVRVQRVFLLQLTPVQRLVASLDLDGHGWLALLADRDGLVFALDGYPAILLVTALGELCVDGENLHSP